MPSILKERDRLIGRSDPVLDRYARITFEKNLIAGQPQAELVAPGHPLLEAMVDVVLERFQPLLCKAACWSTRRTKAKSRAFSSISNMRFGMGDHESGEPRAISQRLQFIFLKEDGSATDGGPAPYLDCRPITAEERAGCRGRDCPHPGCRAMSKAGRSAMRSNLWCRSISTR